MSLMYGRPARRTHASTTRAHPPTHPTTPVLHATGFVVSRTYEGFDVDVVPAASHPAFAGAQLLCTGSGLLRCWVQDDACSHGCRQARQWLFCTVVRYERGTAERALHSCRCLVCEMHRSPSQPPLRHHTHTCATITTTTHYTHTYLLGPIRRGRRGPGGAAGGAGGGGAVTALCGVPEGRP